MKMAPPPGPEAGPTLLLVDDNTAVLSALRLMLESVGFSCEVCSDPIQAITYIERNSRYYTAVLCDIRMPLFSGIELLKLIHAGQPDLPVVMMSGHATKLEQQEAFARGAVGFLRKPFLPSDLLVIIDRYLDEPDYEEPQAKSTC